VGLDAAGASTRVRQVWAGAEIGKEGWGPVQGRAGGGASVGVRLARGHRRGRQVHMGLKGMGRSQDREGGARAGAGKS
jgi:hypothetical protein